MNKESLYLGFPYAVVLVIAPVALILDLPVVAIAVGTLGLIVVAGAFSHLARSTLMIVTLGEMSVGVALLLPEFAEFRDTLRLVVGIVVAVAWLVILVGRLSAGRAQRRSDVIEQSLDDMPLAELVPSLTHIGFTEYAGLERRIVKRLKSDEAEAVPLIIECYRASKREAEKDRLIKAVGGLSGDEAMTFLKRLLVNEKNSSLLRTVMRVSGRTGRADMVAGLARLADEQDDGYLALDALEALGRNGTPEAFDSIRRRLAGIEDADDRDRAMDGILGGLREGRAAIAWLAEVVREGGNPALRARAARILGGISPGALNDVLAGDWDKELWKAILEQIGWLSHDERRKELGTP